jgi:hypothetical protein
MVTILSAPTRPEDMRLVFGCPDSDSNLIVRPPTPLMRCLLPALALKGLELRGNGECLDVFVARIDVPSFNSLKIMFRDRLFFVVDLFHLPRTIGRVEKF